MLCPCVEPDLLPLESSTVQYLAHFLRRVDTIEYSCYPKFPTLGEWLRSMDRLESWLPPLPPKKLQIHPNPSRPPQPWQDIFFGVSDSGFTNGARGDCGQSQSSKVGTAEIWRVVGVLEYVEHGECSETENQQFIIYMNIYIYMYSL